MDRILCNCAFDGRKLPESHANRGSLPQVGERLFTIGSDSPCLPRLWRRNPPGDGVLLGSA